MLGLYATKECTPLDLDALTDGEAHHLGGLLHKTLKQFLPLWELEVVSVRLANILRINEITTLGEIVKVHPWNWKRMKKMGRTSYDELRGLVRNHGIHLSAWEEIKLV